MTDLLTANLFRDRSVQDDPYPYFDALRAASPVWQEPHYGVFMVTGHDEALAVYNDSATFSSCNVVSGPFMRFPEPFVGDDVSDLIERTATSCRSATSSPPSTLPGTPPTER